MKLVLVLLVVSLVGCSVIKERPSPIVQKAQSCGAGELAVDQVHGRAAPVVGPDLDARALAPDQLGVAGLAGQEPPGLQLRDGGARQALPVAAVLAVCWRHVLVVRPDQASGVIDAALGLRVAVEWKTTTKREADAEGI